MERTITRLSWKKGLFCTFLFTGLLALTAFLFLKDQDLGQLLRVLRQTHVPWLIVGGSCMVFFFCCEALNIQRGLRIFGSHAPYQSCLRYAITGFFFSSVTPSASGGQPMQLYDMYQDGHSPAHGTLALLTEFFSFQLAAVAIALISFSLYRNEILSLRHEVWLLFVVGTALNVVVVLLLAVAVFSPKILPSLWRWLMNLAQKLFPHRAEQWRCWGEVQLSELHQCAARYRKERSTLLKCFCTSFAQVAAYHSIPYWIALSLGVTGQSLWEMIALQSVLFLSVSSLPLPGAVGLSEGGFLIFFRGVFPATMLSAGMMLSRAVSFYCFLLLAGVFVATRTVYSFRTPLHNN